MLYPAAIPAAALAAGIAAGIFLPIPLHPAFLVLVVCWIVAMWATLGRRERLFAAAIIAGFVVAGALLGAEANAAALRTPLGTLFDRSVPPHQYQIFANLEGVVGADAAFGPNGATLAIEVDRIEIEGRQIQTSGGVLLGMGGDLAPSRLGEWRAGRRVRVAATLRRPARYLNPGVPDSWRAFEWKGTTLVGSAKSASLVSVVARGTPVSEAFASVRAGVRTAVARTVAPWSERSAAVVTAILIGDRAGLDDEMQRALQEAGTYHVIAISGGNIAIFAGLLVAILRLARAGPRTSAALIVLMLVLYAALIGGGSSVGRATLMAVLYFVAQFFDQKTSPGNVAAVAAMALFCLNPLEVVDAGFALTFGATLGLLIGMPLLKGLSAMPRWTHPAAALLAASTCAEVALLPVSAYVFSRVTAAGLLLNFAAIPLMTVVQIAGTSAVTLAGLCPRAAFWSGFIAHLGVRGLLGSASLVALMPWAARRVPPPALAMMACYYAAVIGALLTTRIWRRLSVALVIACGWWIVVAPAPRRGASLLRVTYIDVGQGDAAILQFPNGHTLSIDAGGIGGTTFDIGSRVVSPTYWALGVRRLDYMSITHGDPDHIGGAASVFRDFHPAEIWYGVAVPPHQPSRQLRALADAAGVPWRTLLTADRLDIGGAQVVVRHPPEPDWERQRVRNDDSEVLEIVYGGVSLVFTGDIGSATEHAIASSFPRAGIRILKVPHHGSATSSSIEFLGGLRPDIAVISDGRGNPFGHPVPAVLDRYRAIGAAIYRTDLDGAVTIETDGETVRLRTFTNRRLTLRTHRR